ncbi:unnamed protein product [Parnassius apollo]|uniref:(apollo) hypothetical protein n=1 Tax=Parnassius apollo TaxID=110799 RepID=A0A8S3WT67_PARAO|nr:unnamed protein product [Parnassius apollo]
MILMIAQLEILNERLINVANNLNFDHKIDNAGDLKNDAENKFIVNLNQTIAHYGEVSKKEPRENKTVRQMTYCRASTSFTGANFERIGGYGSDFGLWWPFSE